MCTILGKYVAPRPIRKGWRAVACRMEAEMGLRVDFGRGILTALIVIAASCSVASAESYPSQRMTLVVPFPPGSATDSVTRHLAESVRTATKVTVVVENKPGADGNLAALA